MSTALQAHVLAVLLPQTAHRSFGDARLARLHAAAAHLHHRRVRGRALHSALHESRRRTVLERNVPGRPDEVRLLHAPLGHFPVVARVPERGPREFGPAGALGENLAHGEAVHDLLQDETREDGEYLQSDAVAELVYRFEHLRCLELVTPGDRAHARLLIFVAGRIGFHHGEAHVAATLAADDHAAFLLEAIQAEGREEE